MSNQYFQKSTIENWIVSLDNITANASNIYQSALRQPAKKSETKAFVKMRIGEDREVTGSIGDSIKRRIFQEYNDFLFRPIDPLIKSPASYILKKGGALKRSLQSQPVRENNLVPINTTLLNDLNLLNERIINFPDSAGSVNIVNNNNQLASSSFAPVSNVNDLSNIPGVVGIPQNLDDLQDIFEALKGVFSSAESLFNQPMISYLSTNRPNINAPVDSMKSSANTINTDLVADLSDNPVPSTGININERGTRDLIDNIEKTNNSTDANNIVNNTNSGISLEVIEDIINLCEIILSYCKDINLDTDNLIYNVNVRFRNITLPDDQDSVYNLSNWLYAFQKQVMNSIYDNGEFIKQINDNQKTDSESLQTILNQVVQALTELTVVNTNINTAIQTTVDTRDLLQTDIINQNEIIHRIETNLTQFVADTKAQLDSIEEKQNVQANEIEIVKNLCFQILAKPN